MKKKLCFLVFLLCISILGGCKSDKEYRLGTGNIAGVYIAYGNALSSAISKSDANFTLSVKQTAGSAANLRLMQEGFLDFAIVQSDILSEAVCGARSFQDGAVKNVFSIAGLYTEQLQVVVPASSDIYSLQDLKEKRVSVGEVESGVYGIAKDMLTACGINESNLTLKNLSFSDSAKALKNNEIDAFFVMAGAPVNVITSLSDDMDVRVLSIDERTIDYMTALYDGVVRTVIKEGTYKGQTEDIVTIGVKAVLVCKDNIDNETVKKILDVLFSDADEFRYSISKNSLPDKATSGEDLPGKMHPCAKEYFGK